MATTLAIIAVSCSAGVDAVQQSTIYDTARTLDIGQATEGVEGGQLDEPYRQLVEFQAAGRTATAELPTLAQWFGEGSAAIRLVAPPAPTVLWWDRGEITGAGRSSFVVDMIHEDRRTTITDPDATTLRLMDVAGDMTIVIDTTLPTVPWTLRLYGAR